MPKYYVTNESSEDTFCETSDLDEAVRIAKQVASGGPVGDLVMVESEGRGLRQFTLRKDGTVAETTNATPATAPPSVSESPLTTLTKK
jgi:hypothetical protein